MSRDPLCEIAGSCLGQETGRCLCETEAPNDRLGIKAVKERVEAEIARRMEVYARTLRDNTDNGYPPHVHLSVAEVRLLLAALEAAWRDSDRLDWVEENASVYSSAIEMAHEAWLSGDSGDSLRARIDQTRFPKPAAATPPAFTTPSGERIVRAYPRRHPMAATAQSGALDIEAWGKESAGRDILVNVRITAEDARRLLALAQTTTEDGR